MAARKEVAGWKKSLSYAATEDDHMNALGVVVGAAIAGLAMAGLLKKS